MHLQDEINKTSGFLNIEMLARQVVEGFVSGMHKSPFHGFSAEFAEHKIYNPGESTKHIDWKLFAKIDRLYTKRYEEETNLRCHVVLDASSSMYYPEVGQQGLGQLNKIGFSALATACLMQILKKQRDAIGLSIYSDQIDYYAPAKGSERHHQMLLHQLEEVVRQKRKEKTTKTYTFLHQIAEKIHRRSLIFVFTDMFQADIESQKLFEALQHLTYNKHEVVLFHTYDHQHELQFDFDNRPTRYRDVETGEHIDIYADTIKDNYKNAVSNYFYDLKMKCAQYKIKYVAADIQENFDHILTTYLVERRRFA